MCDLVSNHKLQGCCANSEFNVALWELELSARRGETSGSFDRCNFQSSKRSKDFQGTQSFTEPQK